MVPVRVWQWQYWQILGQGLQCGKIEFLEDWQWQWHSDAGSGSGRMAVVPIDAADQGGSNGTG
jgi:hypothetical protein